MKKILLSISTLFLASSAFALDCSYLDKAEGKFKKEDLPCVTQELAPLMKTLMGTPLRIDEITSLVDIYETAPGKEITFYYQVDSAAKVDDSLIPSLKENMKTNLIELNCYDANMREIFDLGVNFKYSYNQLNKNLFESIVDKDTCKGIPLPEPKVIENTPEQDIKLIKEELKIVKEELNKIKPKESVNVEVNKVETQKKDLPLQIEKKVVEQQTTATPTPTVK